MGQIFINANFSIKKIKVLEGVSPDAVKGWRREMGKKWS